MPDIVFSIDFPSIRRHDFRRRKQFDSSLLLILFGLDCNRVEPVVVAFRLLEDFGQLIDFGLRGGGGGGREIWFTRRAIPEDGTGSNQFAIVEAVGVWCFTVRGRLRRISNGTGNKHIPI
ncbi:uncharacterized protein LOC120430586 [Culex pipiens pallens]|uniref:uncharacterized protein LOC120430586 n=1 Tax=Culex pipiens pallens TaxID=42434 RepID=UPI0019538015|nr:uncharacterized protein LOC120430586 [Culex pipiens pallens]